MVLGSGLPGHGGGVIMVLGAQAPGS